MSDPNAGDIFLSTSSPDLFHYRYQRPVKALLHTVSARGFFGTPPPDSFMERASSAAGPAASSSSGYSAAMSPPRHMSFLQSHAAIAKPLFTQPTSLVKGSPGIIRHLILDDKRHVLTQDTAGVVKKWSVLEARLVKNYGAEDFEKVAQTEKAELWVPNWFQVDTKLGSVTVRLEYPDCLNAESYAEDVGLVEREKDERVNFGESVLLGLFRRWLLSKPDLLQREYELVFERDIRNGQAIPSMSWESKPAFDYKSKILVILQDSHGMVVKKNLLEFSGPEAEKEIPPWLMRIFILGEETHEKKISFQVHQVDPGLPKIDPVKLNSHPMVKMSQVTSFIAGKLKLELRPEESADDIIVLRCGQQFLNSNTDVGTARAFYKPKEDKILIFTCHLKSSVPSQSEESSSHLYT